MSNIAINTGLRAILTAQSALETLGHNISNANTPGYSRQRLMIGTELPLTVRGLLVGGGVKASSVQRSVDSLLNRRILGQVTVAGRLESRLTGMTEIEAMLGELDGQGIGSLMDDLFSSISQLSTDPEDAILTSGVGQAAVGLASRFNGLANSLGDMRRDTAKELEVRVSEVNEIARQMLALNEEIVQYEGGGLPANDLRDQREYLLQELSKRVDTNAIEDSNGALRVTVAGNTLVSSSRVYAMSVASDTDGDPRLKIEGANGFVPVSGGTIGGLISMTSQFVPGLDSELDALARNLILEMNRVHSTGIPSGGAFHNLVGSNAIADLDKDGKLRDELLSNAGLPFDVQSGQLHLNVTDEATGDVTQHSIQISKSHTTVGELLDAISKVPHLSADLDGFGRAQIVADGGYGFDFSPRLDPNPDSTGTLGGGKASLGTAQGPFGLADGDTLDLTVGGTSFSIAFDTADFEDINAATADEIAAVINANPSAQSAGLTAASVDGRLFVQTLTTGSGATFDVDGGSVLDELGWSAFAGTTISGHDNAVDVTVGGAYQGDQSDAYTFVPNMDGTIGTTPGLVIDVFDKGGNLVASLDVGEGYVPGTEVEVAQGITAKFGLGEVSATEGDMFALEVITDSDTSDVLVALGVNSFFTGTGAADIALREDLEQDPSQIATSLTGASGDNQLLLAMLGLQNKEIGDLGKSTFGQYYGDTIGSFGFEVSSTANALDSNESLMSSLDQLKQSVSGVNVDEELVDMVKYEQAFAAASQYINVINELQGELLNLL
jgi:flagellar hook-associated protein 1 FlgK